MLTALIIALLALGAASFLTMLLFLWVSEPETTGLLLGLFIGALPLFAAAYARKAQARARTAREEDLLTAYTEQVILTLAERGTPAATPQIAAWLGLRQEQTDALLAKLNVDDRMSSSITDDGELEYTVIDPARRLAPVEPRLRVADSTDFANAPSIVDADLDDAEQEPVLDAPTNRSKTP